MTEPPAPTKTPLTARETEILIIAFQCLENNDLKIDYEKFMKMADYSTKHSACSNLSTILKRKIKSSTVDNFSVAASSGGQSSSPKKRAAPKDKDLAKGEHDGHDDGEVVKSSPQKRGAKKAAEEKGGKRTKMSNVKVEAEGHEHDEKVGGNVKQEGEGGSFKAAFGGRR